MTSNGRDRRTDDQATDAERKQDMPPAGPHATEELTNKDATPGAGSLPDEKVQDEDSGTG